jgi:hypothetical protein
MEGKKKGTGVLNWIYSAAKIFVGRRGFKNHVLGVESPTLFQNRKRYATQDVFF